MDVRIGSIDTTIVDSGPDHTDSALVERIVRRVLAALRQRDVDEKRRKEDAKINAPDDDDVSDYG